MKRPHLAAAQLMADHDVSGLPVVDEGGRLPGVVSDGDVIVYPRPRAGAAAVVAAPQRRAGPRPDPRSRVSPKSVKLPRRTPLLEEPFGHL
jgi:CBS domain-containing protein